MEVSSSRVTNETISDASVEDSVAVVLTTYNDVAYLREALSSVFAQERQPDEVIVVDDGSRFSPAPIVADFPKAILLRKNNGGLSSARSLGLQTARCRYITFLDADNRLESNAITSGPLYFARGPDAAMVYGGHRRIRATGERIGSDNYKAVSEDATVTCSRVTASGCMRPSYIDETFL